MSLEIKVRKHKSVVSCRESAVRVAKFVLCRMVIVFCLLTAYYCWPCADVYAERIKDIASFEGVRDNQLIGYGLVVGLDGSGDKGQAALQGIINMLNRMGLTIKATDLKSKNVAAVVVTSALPPFAKPGIKIDALVSTIGDAKSIQGGTLLLTPLKGADSIGGFIAEGAGATSQKNHPSAGRIPEGATVEKEPPFILGNGKDIRLFLHKADFTTADMITKQINSALKGNHAAAIDSSAIMLSIPEEYKDNLVGLITKVEMLDVKVDMPAKVVINERTGTIVIGENVTIAPVAIAHGSISIEVRETPEVSQPLPFSPNKAETVTVPRTDLTVHEQKGSLVEISGVTLGEIIKALNALGVTPRDLISIIQALKAAGALTAEIEII